MNIEYPSHINVENGAHFSQRDPSIYAQIIADSISPTGQRLTTFEVRFHRWVLAEFNTHRMLSKNSASSRAIPIWKRIEQVRSCPAVPVKWGRDQSGMQDAGSITPELVEKAKLDWIEGSIEACDRAERLCNLGIDDEGKPVSLHKGLVNRLLEPWLYHTVIVSGTSWDNFYNQRDSALAQPEIEEVAKAMRLAHQHSTPVELDYGQYHTPYVGPDETLTFDLLELLKLSVSRCTRVSYENQGGVRELASDMDLYDRLVYSDPMHASPLEHIATPSDTSLGNFKGWGQMRHLIEAKLNPVTDYNAFPLSTYSGE